MASSRPPPLDANRPGHDHLPVAIATTDEALRTLSVNKAWSDLVAGPVEGTSWLALVHPTERGRIRERLETAVENDRGLTFEARGTAPDQWLEVRVAQAESPASLVVVAIDITEQKQREALLTVDAFRDPLTGLYNRRMLLEHIPRALARLDRTSSFLAVAFIDLDRFKLVNDRYGHAAGDHALKTVAGKVQQTVRRPDILARIGGDEFVAVCEDLSSDVEGLAIGRRIAATLSEPISVSPSETVRLTASVGVAATDDPDERIPTLLDRADRAMYEARRRGTPAVQAETTRRPRQEDPSRLRSPDGDRQEEAR